MTPVFADVAKVTVNVEEVERRRAFMRRLKKRRGDKGYGIHKQLCPGCNKCQ